MLDSGIIKKALDPNTEGENKIESRAFLLNFSGVIGPDLYREIIEKYHIIEPPQGGTLSYHDLRTILIGISTYIPSTDLQNNPTLSKFWETYQEGIQKIAQSHRIAPDEHHDFNKIVDTALNHTTIGTKPINTRQFLSSVPNIIGVDLYNRIIKKYHITGPSLGGNFSYNDLRAILIGLTTNITPEDLKNPTLYQFLENNKEKIHEIAKTGRKELAHHMDKKVLSDKSPITSFFLRVGKQITDIVIKKNDLKDAFAGVRINKAFEEDIKTAATLDYAKTYKANYSEVEKVMTDSEQTKKLASGLYLASNVAYRNLNDGSIMPILDDDGKERLYTIKNIVNDKGLVCTALVPYVDPKQPIEDRPLDIKVLFRGTYNLKSASIDLESTGAGSKTMRDNRIKLLDEVNELVGELQATHSEKQVSLSIHGHSLGGAFAERFTSELNQAIYHEKTQTKPDPTLKKLEKLTLTDELQKRINKNNKEMYGKNYDALANLHSITVTAANSARLSKKEANIGEDFIRLTQQIEKKPKLNLNYFKAKGDWVSQAGKKSLGAGLSSLKNVTVSVLSKVTGYGGITAMHPILGHCDHEFTRVFDTKNTNAAPTFEYFDNKNNPKELEQKLSSGKFLPKKLQEAYAKVPTPMIEPLTWARKQVGKISGQEAKKGYGVKTETEKKNEEVKKPRM